MTNAAAQSGDPWVPIVAALVGSLLSGVLAFIVTWARLRSDRRQWRMDAMVRGMGYLTGGTQNRSVGIGVISSLIDTGSFPRDARSAIDSVLWNQLIHIAHEGDASRKTERENAKRLIDLVEQSQYKDDPRLDEIRKHLHASRAKRRWRLPMLRRVERKKQPSRHVPL